MVVIGIGSQRAATAAEIAAIISEARVRAGSACDLVISLQRGAMDWTIDQSARSVGLGAHFLAVSELALRAGDCITHSEAAMSAYALPSVAEAAALAGAGEGSRLIVPRFQHARVTAAVAISAENRT